MLSDRVTAAKSEALNLRATRSITGQGGLTVGSTVSLVAQTGSITGGNGAALRFDVPTTATLSMRAAQEILATLTDRDVRLGTLQAGGLVRLDIEDGALLVGSVSGNQIELTAATGIGRDKLVFVDGGPILAAIAAGDLRLGFEAGKAALNAALAEGAGRIELVGRGTDLTIGNFGVEGAAHDIDIDVASLTQNAGIVTATGDISIETQRDLIMQDADAPITANAGAAMLKVGGNLTAGVVTAKGRDRRSLDVDVTGDLLLAPGVIGARFIGDAAGSDARI